MAKKNNHKFKIGFDDIKDYSVSDIDFNYIGDQIKGSISSTLNNISRSIDNRPLPPARDIRVCAQKPPELGKSRLMRLFGLSAMVITGLVIFSFVLEFASGIWVPMRKFIMSLVLMGIWAGIYDKGKEYRDIGTKYTRILREMGKNTVISVRDLAGALHQSEKDTVKDLIYMMKRDYFKQARLVEDNSIFILDIPTYKLYKQQAAELPRYDQQTVQEEIEISTEDISAERAEEILAQGKLSLAHIDDMAMIISNTDIKQSIKDLRDSSNDILEIVSKYPDKAYGLNKFSEYYLPTTVKLLESYREFELMGSEDPDIRQSMDQIADTLDTMGDAFNKIKIELLSDRAMDVQTDIDTINLLLNQEGYIGDDWSDDE